MPHCRREHDRKIKQAKNRAIITLIDFKKLSTYFTISDARQKPPWGLHLRHSIEEERTNFTTNSY